MSATRNVDRTSSRWDSHAGLPFARWQLKSCERSERPVRPKYAKPAAPITPLAIAAINGTWLLDSAGGGGGGVGRLDRASGISNRIERAFSPAETNTCRRLGSLPFT